MFLLHSSLTLTNGSGRIRTQVFWILKKNQDVTTEPVTNCWQLSHRSSSCIVSRGLLLGDYGGSGKYTGQDPPTTAHGVHGRTAEERGVANPVTPHPQEPGLGPVRSQSAGDGGAAGDRVPETPRRAPPAAVTPRARPPGAGTTGPDSARTAARPPPPSPALPPARPPARPGRPSATHRPSPAPGRALPRPMELRLPGQRLHGRVPPTRGGRGSHAWRPRPIPGSQPRSPSTPPRS